MILLIACQAAPTVTTEGTPSPFRFTAVGKVPNPTAIETTAADPGALYVVEQGGRIWRIEGGTHTVVLDLSSTIVAGGEMGLLGLTFHPRWPEDRRIFVNYTFGKSLRTRVASYELDPGSHRATGEIEVLAFDQPYQNHNSGSLAFGPDGMLYIGVGDGGAGGDPHGHGQDLSTWLGSILRVDVSLAPYRVPPDNPFVGRTGAKPEIWAYGLRNPWGMHFDAETLWFADVGQNAWEEVNVGKAGANYGWDVMEGAHCFKALTCREEGLDLPVGEYGRDLGGSVTGGFVYRGPSIPAIDGAYVYADYGTGRFWAVRPPAAPVLLGQTELHPSTFGVDPQGRLYVGDYGGVIWRLDAISG